jgi:hypothetical protein
LEKSIRLKPYTATHCIYKMHAISSAYVLKFGDC